MLHDLVAKKLGNIGESFQKFARQHAVSLSNKTSSMLEKSRQKAALREMQKTADTKSELASLKVQYKEMKTQKAALVQKGKTLKEEIELAEVKKQITTTVQKMKATKKRMVELGYKDTAQQMHALTFQKLYTIKYGGSAYRYNNDPTHPGVRQENDGGAYSKYGWNLDPGWHGAQKCEEYSKCKDVFIPGSHEDGSATCQDDPMYVDCDGDSCQYYEEFPEECGKHDHDCGGPDTGHFAESLENPCKSQGTKMQGCCVCQHHKEKFDGCGTPNVGAYSDGWTCSESPSEYHDAGCGTWETCEERLQKESWYDRFGNTCAHYEDNPDMCTESLKAQYKGHDASECCPKELDRPCGHKPCPAGTFGVSAGPHSETVDSTCTKCPAGKYNTLMNQHSSAACISCIAGKYGPEEGAIAESECLLCDKGKYSSAVAANAVS